MKIFWTILVATLLSSQVMAESIRCKDLNGGPQEVILREQGKVDISQLTKEQFAVLGEAQDYYQKIELTYFVGEATPWTMQAIAGVNDVYFTAVSADGSLQLTIYLDELGENDISSELILGGKKTSMNCQ